MIRVVVTGSECTGKTTLALALGEHYPSATGERVRPGLRSTEGLRAGVRRRRSDRAWSDRVGEGPRRARLAPLVIQDTDLLSTVIYSHHYYDDCPGWIEEAQVKRLPDLYLLGGIDVPWVADGDQRDRPDRRQEMQEIFRSAVIASGVKFLEVWGSREERWKAARSAVDRLLSS